jgi:NADH:ubiquinone oxidoreductase subunit F (NADH-binding)
LAAIADEIGKLAEGRSTDIRDVKRWLLEVEGRGACSHPDGVARQITSALKVFATEVSAHSAGWCTKVSKRNILPIPLGVSQ